MKKSLILIWTITISTAFSAPVYDPSKPVSAAPPVVHDFVVHDGTRHRDLPVRIFLPDTSAPAPVILFSHGLGGSNKGYSYLGIYWAARGYVVVCIQHPGSDEAIWKESVDFRKSMKQAASVENLVLRLKDIPAVLDQLAIWNAESGHPLSHRMDLEKTGMAGHSFGALTTQGVSGESLGWAGTRFTDPRIKAALCLSPGSPLRGSVEKAFRTVKLPWMLMTGTNDVSAIGGQNLASRLAVFSALPDGGKYELVLNGADHMAFTDLPAPKSLSNPMHHRAIEALSTAFWDAWLQNNQSALAWLEGGSALSVLTPADTFQKK